MVTGFYFDIITFYAITLIGVSVLYFRFKNKMTKSLLVCVSLSLVVFFVTLESISYFFIQNTKATFKEKLIGYAPAYAFSMVQLGLKQISESTSSDDPIYLNIIEAQLQWLKDNPFVADVYAFSKNKNGQVILLIDSETDYNKDGHIEGEYESRTDIGEVYYEDQENVNRAFAGHYVFHDSPTLDRWGSWVSGYYPLKEEDGSVKYVVGVDFQANDYEKAIQNTRWTVYIPGILMLIFYFIALNLYIKSKK